MARKTISFKHPIVQTLFFQGITVIRLDPNTGDIANSNVYGYNEIGDLEWVIEESSHGIQEDKPYMFIEITSDQKLITSN